MAAKERKKWRGSRERMAQEQDEKGAEKFVFLVRTSAVHLFHFAGCVFRRKKSA